MYGKMNSGSAYFVKNTSQSLYSRGMLHIMSSMFKALSASGYGDCKDNNSVLKVIPFVGKPPTKETDGTFQAVPVVPLYTPR